MNEELQNKSLEILQQILDGISATGSFVLDQIPDIALQYITYYRFMYSFGLVTSVLLISASLGVIIFLLRNKTWEVEKIYMDKETEWSIVRLFTAWSALSILFIVTLVQFTYVNNLIKVWFAPKVFLLERLALLIR